MEEVHSDLMLKYTKLKSRAKEFDSDSEDELALVASGSSGSSGGSNGGNSNVSKQIKSFRYTCDNKVTSPLKKTSMTIIQTICPRDSMANIIIVVSGDTKIQMTKRGNSENANVA